MIIKLPPLVLASAGCILTASVLAQEDGSTGRPDSEEPQIPIHFRGFLPGTANPRLEGTFEVEFRLYRSPQGGGPVWRETQQVTVADGLIDVWIGNKKRIPMSIHEATFKWLGASVNGSAEVYPRYHAVSVVYVSEKEALLAHEEHAARGTHEAYGTHAVVSATTEDKLAWREALDRARKAGGDLPDYEAWYAALEAAPLSQLAERTGHYEWVLPWAYDTASHGRFNRYFRGRYEGCDYMDLSPAKRYHYRIARPAPDGGRLPAAGRSEER